jgi:hypothetical protein
MSPSGPERGAADLQGVPVRGILIGAVLAFVLNVCDAYATNAIRGSYLTLNFSTPAALFFFFWIVLAGGLVGLVHQALVLTRSELITIYIMLVVACCIPGMGFTQFMIPCLLGSTYYATPENDWDFLYNQYIPSWMIPRGEGVARYFFEGLPQGATIPWEAWVLPLTLWFGFFLALAFAMICIMVILRKQWVDHEKLVYPLVQVPMEMIQKEEGETVGRSFFTNKAMWLGFAVSFILLSVNGIHSYYPEFPLLNRTTNLPLFGGTSLTLWFSPPWTGFFYFVNLEITASIWFFYLLVTLQKGIFNTIGIQSTQQIDFYSVDPFLAHQGLGSMIIFVLVGLWVARRHLRDVLGKAFYGLQEVDDSGEILSYRHAVLGLLLSLLLVAGWLTMIGLTFPVACLFVFGSMILFLALTRVVAEGGIPAMRPPLMTSTFVLSAVGSTALGASGLVALGFSYGWHAEIRSFVMSSVANGLKMSEIIRGPKRRLFWAIVIAILVSLAGSTYITLVMAYKHGGINLNPLFFVNQATQFGPRDMAPRIAAELTGPRWDALGFMAAGGAMMGALMWARHHFLWWPLNPLGFTVSANWKTGHIFSSALLAWFLKLVILRYGGPQLYRSMRPFFLGLILGEIVSAGGFLIVDFITGHIGSFLTQV